LHGDAVRPEPIDLHEKTDAELVALQLHRNDWFCRRAREILAERAAEGRDLSAAAESLRRLAETHTDPPRRLRGLWAAQGIGAADPNWLRGRLADEHASVRAWAVRLLVDDPTGKAVSDGQPGWVGDAFAKLAKSEPAGLVRLHLAGALEKQPHRWRWPIAESLALRTSDADWRELALLLWYGLRGPVAEEPAKGATLAATTPMPTLRRLIARRLAFDADRSAACAEALVSLLEATAGDGARRADVTAGITAAWEARKKLPLPAGLLALVAEEPALADRLQEARRRLPGRVEVIELHEDLEQGDGLRELGLGERAGPARLTGPRRQRAASMRRAQDGAQDERATLSGTR
ncbi:MAG: hypothetical protein ACK528_09510, partial [Alphaproteobacteria bacterium]